MRIAVIPARGGSKRIPRKNVKPFAGKPMIAHSIVAAAEAELFDHIIVSTDDREIAEVARTFGAEVPFVRPPSLSDDQTTILHVVRHALDWAEATYGSVELASCIYATAPFIQADDLNRGLELLQSHPDADFAVAVTSFPYPIQRALMIREKYLHMVQPEYELTRSQDLLETYHDAGQFYWAEPKIYRENDWIISRSIPVNIPRWRVQDIDTPEDWIRAELMWKSLSQR